MHSLLPRSIRTLRRRSGVSLSFLPMLVVRPSIVFSFLHFCSRRPQPDSKGPEIGTCMGATNTVIDVEAVSNGSKTSAALVEHILSTHLISLFPRFCNNIIYFYCSTDVCPAWLSSGPDFLIMLLFCYCFLFFNVCYFYYSCYSRGEEDDWLKR